MGINIIDVLILFICIYLLVSVIKLNGRIKGLEHVIDRISRHIDVPEISINTELRQLLNEDNDVKAVKRVRETLGLSLIEAKQYVDALKQKGNK
ncbi:hypothetical protein [Solibacillus sp. FSL K6-1523]|uniref:hypothetical protein n=1 Tax=Solibacillus sp. FSL K6-1523 TaxID=2921471 RepID=UPI0030F875BB